MKSTRSDWYIPADWLAMLGLLLIPAIAILSAMLFPELNSTRHGNPFLVKVSMVLAMLGIVLLFFARQPLYRQRKFFSFGPKALPPLHRKLYWVAYVFIGMAVALMSLLMLVLK